MHSGHHIQALEAPSAARRSNRTLRQRAWLALSGTVAAVLGVLPHVLHHAGPLAGAALLGGVAGSVLFGAIGFVAAVPFLLRLHRRYGNWRAPGAALVLFAIVFSLSTFVVGPAISGGEESTPKQVRPAPGVPGPQSHQQHH